MTTQVAKLGQLEKGTRVGYGMKVATEQPLDLSVSSRNLPFLGKSFYLDLPRNRSSEILVGTIRKLGGVIESFLSKEITYVVTSNKEARTSDGATRQTNWKNSADSASMEKAEVKLRLSDKKRLSDTPSGSSGLDQMRRQKPGQNPALISRGKELLNKAMQKKDSGASILANAHSWGVHILHVNEVLDYIAKLSVATKKVCNQKTEVAVSGPARKVAQLKIPFLKIEDQSRLFRPLHYHFQSFPQLNLLAARGFSLFEAASPCNLRKDQKRKPKEIDTKCCLARSETEERSPKVKLTLAAKKKRKGYCECCQVAFEELVTHLYSEQHNRFALDATQYSLVDHVISQFPNDFIERQPVCPDSRMLTADDVGAGFPENMVSLSEEVKLSSTGLGVIKDSPTINGCLELLSDCLNLNMTGVERPDELADRSGPGAGKENCHIVDPSSLHLHKVNCPVETSRRRNEMSFRALLEVGVQHAGPEQTGCIQEETICCKLTNNTVSSLNHHFGGCIDGESAAVSRLPASVGEQVEFCHDTPSAVLEINVAKLHLGSKGLMRSDSELNEATSVKRKRSGHLSPRALKRRQIEPGHCLSGPLSAPYQRDEQKPVHTLSCSKGNVAGSMQASVVGQLEAFPRMPCNLAQPLSALAYPTLPKDLQHYEQLLGLWECFSPRTDFDQTMPSGFTGSREEWDLNTATPQGQTTLVKEQGFSCGMDSPALNELSLCCKNDRKGRSVLQEVQQMERVQCASPASPLHSFPSGCGVSLHASPKRVCTVGAADTFCIAPEHVLTSGVKNGTGVTSGESFSSLSDWDVQLLSRLGSLHAMKEHTLDVEDLRRTSVSMQDTGYESHLCSILKPKSELEWVHKKERVNTSCWEEANGIPFNLFEACLNGLTS